MQNGPQEVRILVTCFTRYHLVNIVQIEVVSWITRTALEMICQSGLGYSFDDMTEETAPHPYTVAAKMLMLVHQTCIV